MKKFWFLAILALFVFVMCVHLFNPSITLIVSIGVTLGWFLSDVHSELKWRSKV